MGMGNKIYLEWSEGCNNYNRQENIAEWLIIDRSNKN